MRRLTTAVIGAVLVAWVGCTTEHRVVEVRSAWARDTAPGQSTAALYFTVSNPSEHAFRITAVKVPTETAGTTSMHRSAVTGNGEHDMATMAPVGSVRVAPHSEVRFRPGGLHVMIEQLRHPLKVGDRFPMTLERSNGATLRTEVTVRVAESGAKP